MFASATTTIQEIEREAKKYPMHQQVFSTCRDEGDVEKWINCNINELENGLNQGLKTSMEDYMSQIENAKKEIKIDGDLYYTVAKFQTDDEKTNDEEIHLILHVIGKKGASKDKLLVSRIILPNPIFFDPEKKMDVEVIVDSKIEKLADFFPQLSDKQLDICPNPPQKNMPPCEYQGELSTNYLGKIKELGFDNKFYIKASKYPEQLNNFGGYGIPLYALEGTITTQPNLNNATNINLYYKGLLD